MSSNFIESPPFLDKRMWKQRSKQKFLCSLLHVPFWEVDTFALSSFLTYSCSKTQQNVLASKQTLIILIWIVGKYANIATSPYYVLVKIGYFISGAEKPPRISSQKRDESKERWKRSKQQCIVHLSWNKVAYFRMQPQLLVQHFSKQSQVFKGMPLVKRQRVIRKTISDSNQNIIIMGSLPHKTHTHSFFIWINI